MSSKAFLAALAILTGAMTYLVGAHTVSSTAGIAYLTTLAGYLGGRIHNSASKLGSIAGVLKTAEPLLGTFLAAAAGDPAKPVTKLPSPPAPAPPSAHP